MSIYFKIIFYLEITYITGNYVNLQKKTRKHHEMFSDLLTIKSIIKTCSNVSDAMFTFSYGSTASVTVASSV